MSLLKVFDDRHRELIFGAAPKRIVSLVPSDTFTLAAFGATSVLVGRTESCSEPADVASITSIGDSMKPDVDAICALEPDLVIANQEENPRCALEALVARGVKVYVAFPQRVADGFAHMAKLARILRMEGDSRVRELVKRSYELTREADARRAAGALVPTFCPISMTPLTTIHGTTFASDALACAGASNVFADRGRQKAAPVAGPSGASAESAADDDFGDRAFRYPRISLAEVQQRGPKLVVVPDAPHPFTEADMELLRGLPIFARARNAIVRMPGKDVRWYGAWSIDALPRLAALVDHYRQAN